jgi:hypothetical protein
MSTKAETDIHNLIEVNEKKKSIYLFIYLLFENKSFFSEDKLKKKKRKLENGNETPIKKKAKKPKLEEDEEEVDIDEDEDNHVEQNKIETTGK